MKLRMITFVIFICLYALFAALNLSNTTDINFGFTRISNVPIFLSMTIAFALGAVVMIPFMFFGKKAKNEKSDKKDKEKGKDKEIDKKEPDEPAL